MRMRVRGHQRSRITSYMGFPPARELQLAARLTVGSATNPGGRGRESWPTPSVVYATVGRRIHFSHMDSEMLAFILLSKSESGRRSEHGLYVKNIRARAHETGSNLDGEGAE